MTRKRRDSYAVRQLCSRRTIQIVSGLSTAISNGFSRAPTLGLVPSGSQRAPATQSAKPCLSDDAAQLSHVISDVYSRICGRNRQLSPNPRQSGRMMRDLGASSGMACRFGSRFKLAGARRFSAEPPYNDQPACKPGSVWPAARTADVTTIPLVRRLPGASSNLPERQIRTDPGFRPASFLFGLAPGGVCRAASVAGNAVRSYRTVSPLPRLNATRRGGLFSVALSLGFSSPPDVIRHRLSVEPGLSSPAAFRHWRGAAVRPTDAHRNGDARVLRQGLSCDSLKGAVGGLSQAMALGDSGAGRVSINARNVSSVDGSATPSTRAWRK